MNIGQCDLDPLFGRNIYTSNSCHYLAPLFLTATLARVLPFDTILEHFPENGEL
jgi:hypothetical protein